MYKLNLTRNLIKEENSTICANTTKYLIERTRYDAVLSSCPFLFTQHEPSFDHKVYLIKISPSTTSLGLFLINLQLFNAFCYLKPSRRYSSQLRDFIHDKARYVNGWFFLETFTKEILLFEQRAKKSKKIKSISNSEPLNNSPS